MPHKQTNVKTDKKAIYTKHDELWVFVDNYLNFLYYTGITKDREFMLIYNKLTKYVQSKLVLPKNGGAILDMYHIVCQEPIDDNSV